jgi:hypothetical protein
VSRRADQRGRRRIGRSAAALAALLATLTLIGAACAQPAVSPTPFYTAFPIGPTPWPSGTVGQYGLHIDPSLLGMLPKMVGAQPLVENAQFESIAMDSSDTALAFDRYAAASIGEIGDDDWLNLMLGHFQTAYQTPDALSTWVDDYAAAACSQANAVSASTQETINGFIVDVATCAGGPIAYTLLLDNEVVLSMTELGPHQLGRQLIGEIY